MSVVTREVPKCPLCGSEAVMLDVMFEGKKKYLIYCTNSEHCGLGSLPCNTVEDAFDSWHMQRKYAKKIKEERRDRA